MNDTLEGMRKEIEYTLEHALPWIPHVGAGTDHDWCDAENRDAIDRFDRIMDSAQELLERERIEDAYHLLNNHGLILEGEDHE